MIKYFGFMFEIWNKTTLLKKKKFSINNFFSKSDQIRGISGIFSLFKNIFSKDKQLEVFFLFCNLLAIIW